MVTGSNNGALAIWDIPGKTFISKFYIESTSIEHIRMLQKKSSKCIAVSTLPDIALYDTAAGKEKHFHLPSVIGACIKIDVDPTEELLMASFTDRSLGIFSISTGLFLRKISDVNFTRSFIDDQCTIVVGFDARERAMDFYWLMCDFEIVRMQRITY